MSRATSTKMASRRAIAGPAPGRAREGSRKSRVSAESPVASKPGPKPPYQALSMTAAKNGDANPPVPGSPNSAMQTATETASTAMPYGIRLLRDMPWLPILSCG